MDRLHRRYFGVLAFRGTACWALEAGAGGFETASAVREVFEVLVLVEDDFFLEHVVSMNLCRSILRFNLC